MKRRNYPIAFTLFLLVVVTGCKKSTEPITPPTDTNLIANPSFESESEQSIVGWTFRDSSIYAFVPNAPVGGGSYSIVLRPRWRGGLPLNSVMTKVPLPIGSHRYRLSCWAKRSTERAGSINLFFGSGEIDTMTAILSVPVTAGVWTLYSSEVTWLNQANDSALVVLYGGWSTIAYLVDSTFFDVCKLEKLY